MRIRTFILCLLCCVASAFAKDVITKTDGTKFDAKVEEITETVIKYRKVSNPTGPVYTIPISSVATVLYENGDMDCFHQSTKTDTSVPSIPNLVSDDELILMSGEQEIEASYAEVSDIQLLKIADLYTSDENSFKNKAKIYRIVGWTGGGIILAAGIGLSFLDVCKEAIEP